MRLYISLFLLLVVLAAYPVRSAEREPLQADICVYGDSSAAVMAAITGVRLGRRVVLASPGRHLGGMTVSGLGATDIGRREAIGGIAAEFYRRIHKDYLRKYGVDSRQVRECDQGFRFEPGVARRVMGEMLAEARPIVRLGQPLTAVERDGNRIIKLSTSGCEVTAAVFIDATHEGDLMAAAGVSYVVGREPNSRFNETLNGVQPASRNHIFRAPVDPYVRPGDPSSGLLPGVSDEFPGEPGDGDRRVQAYCFRLCLTDDPANRVPFPRPASYDPGRYELLRRYIKAGGWEGLHLAERLPNRKTDTNNLGAISLNHIGGSQTWPEASPEARAALLQDHRDYQQGLLYFLANDPLLPPNLRAEVGRWGLAADEFIDTGNWPPHLYVREARRMMSDYVMREQNCRGREVVQDSVGLASYRMDSHHVQRLVMDGRAVNEGNVESPVPGPFPISFRSIVPRERECINLLVPVALSASHIAYGSIRMEPVFMILGQSAATAASICVAEGLPVQALSYGRLQEQLQRDGQILAPPGGVRLPAGPQLVLEGVVVDDSDARLSGDWQPVQSTASGVVGGAYRHDDGGSRGACTAEFVPDLPADGFYEVVIHFPRHVNRAGRIPVSLEADGVGSMGLQVAQSENSSRASLGAVYLPAGKSSRAIISNSEADGVVTIDAVQFIPR